MTKSRMALLALSIITGTVAAATQTREHTLKRADSFFGFHFDFHASANDREIGKTLTEGMIDSLLTMTKPDYIQVDCKGHAGYSSYPTKVGNQAGGYTQDILKLFREVTRRHHVALYVHYSGLWDQRAIEVHPWWGIVRADSTRDKLKTSFYSGYLDSLLIPQLEELSDVYQIDGAWIDGDCWAAEPDYSPQLLQDFARETGITTIPRSDDDPAFKPFLEFNRTIFKRHVEKYIDAIHQHNPKFQITSNWAYSSLMPEKVEIGVDYLSGDVAGQNCVNNAAYQARCLALQGKPWDLMAWSFGNNSRDGFFVPKTLAHLEQEAAEVMAVGGGFQSYWTQNRDGSLKSWNFPEMADLAKFCRERQVFSQGSSSVPQIAVWYSVASWKKKVNSIYAGSTGSLESVLTTLLDGQHSVNVLMDHQLKSELNKYALLVIPQWTDLDQELKQDVLTYVSGGGALLVVGGNAVKEFELQLGVKFEGPPQDKAIYIGHDDDLAGINGTWQPVKAGPGVVPIGSCYSLCDSRYPTGNPVATMTSYGKGKIAGFYVNIGDAYYNTRSPIYRKLMNEVVAELFPEPVLRVSGSEYVHTVLSRKNSSTLVHLINTGGAHFNSKVYTYDEVPSLGPISVSLRSAVRPSSVLLQPSGTQLKYSYKNKIVSVTVPKLAIHSVVEIVPPNTTSVNSRKNKP